MSDPTPQEIHADIADGLACTHLEVDGDGQHFFATIVSGEFEGLSRVRRHQRVYEALGEKMRERVHALSMKTLTPAEWAKTGGPVVEHGASSDAPAVSTTTSPSAKHHHH